VELSRLSALRPRTVWDLLDDAFDLYRERFALLAGIAAVPFVPAYLLNTLVTTVTFKRFQEAAGDADATNVFIPLLIYAGATIAGQPILLAARTIQYAVTSAALEERLSGIEPEAKRAWKRTLPRFFALLFASFGAALIVLSVHLVTCGSLAFLVVPLVALTPTCLVLEKRSLRDGFRRGWNLGVINYGRGLGLNVLLMLLEFAIQLGLTVLALGILALIPGQTSNPESTGSFVSMQAAQAIAALFVAPLGAVATTLFYFDCRVRREGLDLTALATETDVALAEVPR
jgi:hypothetical protein